ncbi:MAG: 3-dehydroquinate synthase, partial [Chloroflexi bacterium]|nr:3-dehydroquinate synthase [Chloroflexota bacterium]
PTLLGRLAGGPARPLLAGEGDRARERNLARLLEARAGHYASFSLAVESDGQTLDETALGIMRIAIQESGRTRFWLDGYAAVYGAGLLPDAAGWLAGAAYGEPPLVVITDSNVAPLIGASVARALDAPLVVFPAGECHKTLDTVRVLYEAALAHGMERGGTILAVGGGVVGDLAGFVAATLLRGVRWANLPTTLLAMVDAALGGKTGVDLPGGKNLVGAFHPPALVLADSETLATLPPAELRSGLAEVIKAGVIGDPGLLKIVGGGGHAELRAALVRAAGMKVGIVNADPYERGERAKLNLGHTVGHGVEAASGYRLRHGEAIAVGLVAEARLAEELGLAARGLAGQLAEVLGRAGLPTRCPGLAPQAIRAAMSADKKKAGGLLKFALPAAPGDVRIGVIVSEELLLAVLVEMVEAEA